MRCSAELLAMVAAQHVMPLMHGGAKHDQLNRLALERAKELIEMCEEACVSPAPEQEDDERGDQS